MPVNVQPQRLLLGLLLGGLLACGDDSGGTAPGVGTGPRPDDGDASIGMDASPDGDTGDGDTGDGDTGDGDTGDGDEDAGLTRCPNDCDGLGDECNTAVCNTDTMECELVPVADQTPCGDDSLTNCTFPDRCVAGTCEARHADVGTICGDQGVDCRLDDSCDGNGNCIDAGFEAPGSACGDPSSDGVCDLPDTCSSDGQCLDNHASTSTDCGSEELCMFAPRCDGAGACSAPQPKPATTRCGPEDEPIGIIDTCHPRDMMCDGAGGCDTAPGNSPTLMEGQPCGDPTSSTCTAPDTCSAGRCAQNHTASGVACGDPSNSVCDNPDSCNGRGDCVDNAEPGNVSCLAESDCALEAFCSGTGTCDDPAPKDDTTICGLALSECHLAPLCDGAGSCGDSEPAESGAACGDPFDSGCDNPDTCDGLGGCQDNLEPVDTLCGNTSTTDCDKPDTCDGGGECLVNYEPDTTECGTPGECMVSAMCVGDGSCGEPSVDVGCEMTLSGLVVDLFTRSGLDAMTVQLVGSDPLRSVNTAGDGSFTITAPVGQEFMLRVLPSTGRWGSLSVHYALPTDTFLGAIGVPDDTTAAAALVVPGVDPLDTADAAILAIFTGQPYAGGESVTLDDIACSPTSCGPITEGPSGMVASNTLMGGDFVAFTGLTPGDSTGVTFAGSPGMTTCGSRYAWDPLPLEAHTLTLVPADCTAP